MLHFVKRVGVPAEREVPVMGTRHRFTPDYHRNVATLVLDSGSSIASMTRDLGLGETVVGQWIKIERERRQAAAQGRPDAVVDLIKRLVTVSMRTQELLETLPKLEIPEVQN